MSRILIAAVTLSSVAVLSSVSASADECSNSSLKGHYTYWLQGVDAAGKAYAEVGQEHYDGAGNVESKIAVSGSGKVVDDKATYTVDRDCSGTVTYTSGPSYIIFVAPDGDSFVFSSSKSGVIQAGENTRVDDD